MQILLFIIQPKFSIDSYNLEFIIDVEFCHLFMYNPGAHALRSKEKCMLMLRHDIHVIL